MPEQNKIMVEVVKAWKWECPACLTSNLEDKDPSRRLASRCKRCDAVFLGDEFLKVE